MVTHTNMYLNESWSVKKNIKPYKKKTNGEENICRGQIVDCSQERKETSGRFYIPVKGL